MSDKYDFVVTRFDHPRESHLLELILILEPSGGIGPTLVCQIPSSILRIEC